jgi:hypothetical protein
VVKIGQKELRFIEFEITQIQNPKVINEIKYMPNTPYSSSTHIE